MGTDSEDPFLHDEEEEGGPTKSFLEHLEDLRWVLIKCAAVVLVTFVACLFAAPTLVKILTWPLEHTDDNPAVQLISRVFHIKSHSKHGDPTVSFHLGTNTLGSYKLSGAQSNLFGTNLHTVLEIVPVTIGTNALLGLQPSTNQPLAYAGEKKINLINLGPAAAFFLAVQMALYGGIALASPFLFYFIGGFIFPALKVKEKKYTYSGLAVGLLLFFVGVCFCYFFLMPVALRAAAQYSEWMGFQANTWRAEEYISFVCKFILGMGLGFELPVVLLVLVKIGILDYKMLAGFRRYMIVINLILGAVLTTPEVVTQILMAIPLQVLYEITIWIAWYWERKERKRNDAISV